MRLKQSEIIPIMVGTAGHVDHGKTALVGLLTGCQTDTLKEEKERGLSIDLGFAPCRIGPDQQVGIVDVPGHIDFIKNMVAGASSIDVLILVIAADDSLMPQTLEHLNIICLLRRVELMCVITKTDLVDFNRLQEVHQEVRLLLDEHHFFDAPIVEVSNITLDGLGNVRNTLQRCVQNILEKKACQLEVKHPFRMYIERVFSVPGHGTVVTGIPLGGSPLVGDELMLMPLQTKGRIRSVQNFKQASEMVISHTCNAINISQIDVNEVKRGMTLCAVDAYRSTQTLIAEFKYIGKKSFKEKTQVRFHAGTATVVASIRSLWGDEIHPNSTTIVKIKLSEPITLIATDPFLLRQLSPSETLGGGVIISTQDIRLRKNELRHQARLNLASEAVAIHDALLAEMWMTPSAIFDIKQLSKIAGVAQADIIAREAFFSLGAGFCFNQLRIDEVAQQLIKILSAFHDQKPYVGGLDQMRISKVLLIPSSIVLSLINYLLENVADTFKFKNGKLSLKDFEIQMTSKQMQQKEAVLDFLKSCDVAIPAIGTLIENLKITSTELRFILKILIENEEVIQIGNHVFESKIYLKCLDVVRSLPNPIEISSVKELTLLSRNMSVAFLEHLDSKGITKRNGNIRVFIATKEA